MQQRARAILAASMIWGLSASAQTHGEIAPEPIPPTAYEPASCRELGLMHARTKRQLILASVIQDAHHEQDLERTFGVPTPFATIFDENVAPQVSRLKGELLALEAQLERAGCVARPG